MATIIGQTDTASQALGSITIEAVMNEKRALYTIQIIKFQESKFLHPGFGVGRVIRLSNSSNCTFLDIDNSFFALTTTPSPGWQGVLDMGLNKRMI